MTEESIFTPEEIEKYPELLNIPLTIEEMIVLWTKKHEEIIKIVAAGNPDHLSLVDIMGPSQMLFNLAYFYNKYPKK